MRVVAISDTHEKHRLLDLPRGDVLVHAGDVTWRGELDILRDFDAWCAEMKRERGFREVLLIAGNHDFSLEGKKPALPLLTNCRYLEDEEFALDGVRFWGSPWTPTFLRWAFMKDEEGLAERWEKIPDGIDVLVTHGPPHGILDLVPRVENAGSTTLHARIAAVKPAFHVFGHIHEGYGRAHEGATTFLNVSSCDASYELANAPVVFDVAPR